MKRKHKFEVPERHRSEQLTQQQPEQLETIKLQNSIIAQLAEINAKLDFILRKNTEG